MKENKPKGYSYYRTEEQLRAWIKVPPEEKLRWLEEINLFTRKWQLPDAKKIMEKFRSGEL